MLFAISLCGSVWCCLQVCWCFSSNSGLQQCSRVSCLLVAYEKFQPQGFSPENTQLLFRYIGLGEKKKKTNSTNYMLQLTVTGKVKVLAWYQKWANMNKFLCPRWPGWQKIWVLQFVTQPLPCPSGICGESKNILLFSFIYFQRLLSWPVKFILF